MKETEYPGVFLRVKATVIDSIILFLFMMLATDIFSRFENVSDYAKMIVFAFIFILYDPLMITFFGSTVGHRVNKIKVVRLDNGKNINILSAILRFLIKASLGWISLFKVSTSEKRQAIHDSIVKSVVVYDK